MLALTQNLEDLKRLSLRRLIRKGLTLPEAEDVFQSAMLKAFNAEASLREGEKIQNWFSVILKNAMTDYVRGKNVREEREAQFAQEQNLVADSDAELEESFCKCVAGYLEKLPENHSELLKAHFLEGKRFSDLAAVSGESEGNLRVKSLRAREQIKKMFKDCCGVRTFTDLADCGCT